MNGVAMRLRQFSSTAIRAWPTARLLAAEHGIALEKVTPTGHRGVILKQDVQQYILSSSSRQSQSAPSVSATRPSSPSSSPSTSSSAFLMSSSSLIPTFGLCEEVHVSQLMKLVAALSTELNVAPTSLLRAFVMAAYARSLSQFPALNSLLAADKQSVLYRRAVNLMVSDLSNTHSFVVASADKKSIRTLLAYTFQKQHLGDSVGASVGIQFSSCGTVAFPLLSPGTSFATCVYGPSMELRYDASGKAVMTPVFQLSFSGDHRIIDGAACATFARDFRSRLEDVALMFVPPRPAA